MSLSRTASSWSPRATTRREALAHKIKHSLFGASVTHSGMITIPHRDLRCGLDERDRLATRLREAEAGRETPQVTAKTVRTMAAGFDLEQPPAPTLSDGAAHQHIMACSSTNADRCIEVDGASNTAITSNTLLWGQSAAGHQIDVTAGATGTAIKDNLLAYPGTVAGTGAAISVDPTSAAGTTEDYNLVWPDQQGTSTVLEPAYSWAGTNYSSPVTFSQATGQGKHDLVADPQLQAGSPFTDHATAPQFNSADETATGWQTWDLYGHTCQGDPYAPSPAPGRSPTASAALSSRHSRRWRERRPRRWAR